MALHKLSGYFSWIPRIFSMSGDNSSKNKKPLMDQWNKVFDKSLATPIPERLCKRSSSNLLLEDVDEEVTDEIVSGGYAYQERPVTPQRRASVPRRVREKDNKKLHQNVRCEKKEVNQAKIQSVAMKQPLRPLSRERTQGKISPRLTKYEPEKPLVTQIKPLKDKKETQTIQPTVSKWSQPKASVPGGQPISLQTARSLRLLLFGSTFSTFNADFRRQHVNFFRNFSYALSFYKSGPDGVMACLQAFLLKYLLYEQANSFDKDYIKSMLKPLSPDRQKALVSAISFMVWQAGGFIEGVIVLPCGQCDWSYMEHYREDYLTEKLHIFKFKKLEELEYFVKKHLSFFENTSGNGCILILYSVILSRSVERVQDDLSEPNTTLVGPHDSCTQGMINLLLTGKAVSHVFNGCVEFDQRGRPLAFPQKGIESRSEVGFLTIQEHYSPNTITVGSMLKTPKYPVWVVNTGERYVVLFSLNKALLNDWKHERRMELYYYRGSTSHSLKADGVLLTVDTRYDYNPDENPQGAQPIENCIRTKWADAVIEWTERKEL